MLSMLKSFYDPHAGVRKAEEYAKFQRELRQWVMSSDPATRALFRALELGKSDIGRKHLKWEWDNKVILVWDKDNYRPQIVVPHPFFKPYLNILNDATPETLDAIITAARARAWDAAMKQRPGSPNFH